MKNLRTLKLWSGILGLLCFAFSIWQMQAVKNGLVIKRAERGLC